MTTQFNSPLTVTSKSHQGGFGRRVLLGAMLAGAMLLQAHLVFGAPAFVRGTASSVGPVRFSSTPDFVTITGDYTAPGFIDNTLNIPIGRIQYDMINSDQGSLNTWTVYYSPLVGPSIIGATTPIGYVDFFGTAVPQGGAAYGTLLNAGYGLYNYNTGAPWTIDYEVDHITFIWVGAPTTGLPPNAGVGDLAPTSFLPSFDIEFDPSLPIGLVPASAKLGAANFNGQVYGPLPGNPCISLQASNITVYTCSNCTQVAYNAFVTDTCCTNVTLTYNPPPGYCFPLNVTTPVTVTAHDTCGNPDVSKTFLVRVLPAPGCGSNQCITITAPNVLAYTCSNCIPVAYTATAVDRCCTNVTLVFNPPPGTCFPQNMTTPVTVSAFDSCGNSAGPVTFLVTVLPGVNCRSNSCISVTASNIVTYTCSNCTSVVYNAQAFDTCCSNVTLVYNPPPGFCFPIGTTPVTVTAMDACGNVSAPKTFLVKVLPITAGCGPNSCISVTASNIIAYTCSNCTAVVYNATATDVCCTNVSLIYSLPATTCFAVNTTTPVTVNAFDRCGNVSAPVTFLVTVLPGPNCGGATPGLALTGGSTGTNATLNLNWPPVSAQLQQSTDMIHWAPVPGATNPPYVIGNPPDTIFYRLKYN